MPYEYSNDTAYAKVDPTPTTPKTTTNPSTTSLAELTDVYEREGLLGIQALLSRKEEEVVDGIYKFPAWFDEKLKSEFYDMWKCFNRTPWDYFMQGMGYQAKNGRRVVARKLMTEQIIVGEYFHKSSNIGWVFDGNEVHHVFNAELSETAKEHCKTCLKDKEILPGSWHSWPTIEHPNPLPNPTHASPDSTKKCPLEECDRDANHRGIHLPDKGVSQGKESSEDETQKAHKTEKEKACPMYRIKQGWACEDCNLTTHGE